MDKTTKSTGGVGNSLDGLVGKLVIHKTQKEERKVRLMALSGNYAMVRRPRCAPYVADSRDLLSNTKL